MRDEQVSPYDHLYEISPRLGRAVESLSECGHPLGESLSRHVTSHQDKVYNYNRANQNFKAEKAERPTVPLDDMGTLPDLQRRKNAVKESVFRIHNTLTQSSDLAVYSGSQAPRQDVQNHIEKGGGSIGLVNFKELHTSELETVASYWEEINQDLPPGRLRDELKKELETDWEFGVEDRGFTQDVDLEDELGLAHPDDYIDFGDDSRG